MGGTASFGALAAPGADCPDTALLTLSAFESVVAEGVCGAVAKDIGTHSG
ncbi:MAG: hypothetical protein LCH61_05765 [Proteobacteria bacterium]|nr:hypothetical protein [Pseudomonadota bacterium]